MIIKFLQLWKTFLNQWMWSSHEKDTDRFKQHRLVRLISIISFSLKELNIFHQLQQLFFKSAILNHFLSKQQLYIDLDVLKEFEFNIYIYYTKTELNLLKSSSDNISILILTLLFTQKNTELILFLNHLLTNVKIQYWFTKLKVISIVWIIKKIHHIIKASELFMIIYIDHLTAVLIVH